MKAILIFFLWIGLLGAQTSETLLSGIKIDRALLKSTIDQMVKSGQISREDGQRAQKDLAQMKQEDIDRLGMKALSILQNASKTSPQSQDSQVKKIMQMVDEAQKGL